MAIPSALPALKPHRILLAGDWHGDINHAVAAVRWGAERGADGVLHLGDFGIWRGTWGRVYVRGLNRELNTQGMWLAFVDGNHEDYTILESFPMRAGLRPLTQRITHLPRGYRWTWGSKTWLALGGATSLDVHIRRPLIDWWPQEAITSEQAEKVITDGPVDYMLTHDAPRQAPVPGLREDIWRPDALRAAHQHRDLLGTVVEAVHPEVLFHGHMHVRYDAGMRLGDVDARVVGLGDNTGPFDDNLLLVDLDHHGNLVLPAVPA